MARGEAHLGGLKEKKSSNKDGSPLLVLKLKIGSSKRLRRRSFENKRDRAISSKKIKIKINKKNNNQLVLETPPNYYQ